MMKPLLAAVALLTSLETAHGEMLLKDYQSLRQKDAPAAERYLEGVGSALSWANAVLGVEKKDQLFCLPRGQSLDRDAYGRILEELAKAMPEGEGLMMDVPIVLLKGLRRAYPCAESGKAI